MILEEVVRSLAGALAWAALALNLYSLWRGTQRRAGRVLGRHARWLGMPSFYLVATLLFIGFAYAGWIPLPVPVLSQAEPWIFVLGALFYFAGLFLVFWARLALGRNYFASTALAVRLYEDHQLVVTGPFAAVRHPLYLGLMLAAFGSLLIWPTWTTFFFAVCGPFLIFRARKEEQALAAEFGEQWQAYCRRVPMLVPRLFAPGIPAAERGHP